ANDANDTNTNVETKIKNIINEIKIKTKEIDKLEEYIWSGKEISIHRDNEIFKLYDQLSDDFYETGKINYNSWINFSDLIKKAKPSNFGLGTETLYDPNVRKSLEIMACELNPGFV